MINRILAIAQQEYFITKRSLEVIFDLFIYSSLTVVAFSFISKYLAGSDNEIAAYYLVIGLLLWEVVRIGQYSITVSVLWNVWSRNLSNMFVTPLSASEYLISLMVTSLLKSIFVFILLGFIVYFVSGLEILKIGVINLILHFINLTLFAWSMGVLITGIIFRFGTRIQALSWGLIFIFQPLTASFFPVSILPLPLQYVSYTIPATYVFESARKNFTNPAVDWNNFTIAFALNIVYLLVSVLLFYYLFRKSRQTGQFARNEG